MIDRPDNILMEYRSRGILHREDGPAVEYTDDGREWWKYGERHRLDGPAVEYANGTREWWVNGDLHRTDGPAVEPVNGNYEWQVNGILTRFPNEFQRATGCTNEEICILILKYGIESILPLKELSIIEELYK